MPYTFRARTLADVIDASNSKPGTMASLQNVVPSPSTPQQYVPRPAATAIYQFGDFTVPTFGEALFEVGQIAYGFVASATFPGKSQPFAYNYVTQTNIPIAGELSTNLPNSTNTAGDWVPPTVTRVGAFILFTHPGFNGTNGFFGWLDMTSFNLSSLTATTHSNTTLDTFSANPLNAGVLPGQTVTGTGIPANTTVVSVTATSVTISNAATSSGSGVALTFAGGTPSAPRWASGNLNGTPLPSVPVCVNQFNGRAYFGVGYALQMSDAGNALQCTNASNVQVITFQNGVPVTALSSLPFTNLQGGVVQSLIAFQGGDSIQQITGDPTTTNLAVNLIQHGTGTLSPLSLDITPQGLAFIAPDGLRMVTLLGTVTEVIGGNGEGVALPFINTVAPSRTAAAYNTDVYRVAVNVGGITQQEFWYHFKLKSWSGPHTLSTNLIVAAPGTVGFLVMSNLNAAQLYNSEAITLPNSTYIENGQALACSWVTSLSPDTETVSENEIVIATISLGSLVATNFTITVINEAGTQLDQVIMVPPVTNAPIWGAAIWGAFTWAQPGSYYAQHQIYWNQPIVFKQCQISVAFTAGQGDVVGNVYMDYRRLGYPIQGATPYAA
jgi:hypothetical protein